MKPGEKIRLIREQRGLSQAELAKAAGYETRSSISKIEKGDSDPSQKMLVRIAAALDVRPSDLISDDDVHIMTRDNLMLDEKNLIEQYRLLTSEGKVKAFEYLLLLLHQYRRDDDARP